MESLTLNVRVDAKDKKNFEEFCNEVGMNISTAVNMFIKNVIREQRLPFEVRSYKPNDEIIKKLQEAEKEMETSSKRYTLEELETSMNKYIK